MAVPDKPPVPIAIGLLVPESINDKAPPLVIELVSSDTPTCRICKTKTTSPQLSKYHCLLEQSSQG